MSDGIRRRDFLKVLGVTGAGAGLVGCSTDRVEQLIPYVVPPEDVTPGVATWYATACGECPAGCGAWVKTREGRAIKLEGNPTHPVSGGALCSRGHSALQGLYDPDRLATPVRRNADGSFEPMTWEEAETTFAGLLGAAGGNVLLLSGRQGPTLTGLETEWAAAFGGTRVEYEPLSHAPLREACRMAFGTDQIPTYDFEAARTVYSFGADFLETWLSPVEHARGFARMSGASEAREKGRLVVIGPRLSLTGQNADEWIPVDAGSEALVALAMANILAREGADAGPYAAVLQAYDPASVAGQVGLSVETLNELALRFRDEGPGLAVGPGIAGQGRNATAASLAVLLLNAVGGAVGATVHPGRGHLSAASQPAGGVVPAVASLGGGASLLVIHGVNPAYSLPPGSGFVEAMGGVSTTVAISDRLDETARLADFVLPERHWLEGWGDANPRPGVSTVQQPAMRPVPHFDSRPAGDILLAAARGTGQDLGAETFYDYLRARWGEMHAAAGSPGGTFDAFWREALRTGIAELPVPPAEVPALQAPDRALVFEPPALDGDGLALIVYPSPRLGDGRAANRPWLQELPDPVSKISWHSWVEVHPETAAELGVQRGDIVRVVSPHGDVEAPVYPYAGIRRNTAALAMGGGHAGFGRFADARGANPMVLLPGEIEQPSGTLVHLATRVTIEPTGEWRRLATVAGSEDHRDRPIAPAVELAVLQSGEFEAPEPREFHELQAVGGFVPTETDGAAGEFPLEGARHGEYDPEAFPRWAMAIDLDKCTGCSACVTACQSENNVAWVGENMMTMGRDLQWIRLERYYGEINADEPGPLDVRFLPMLCQHCGNAPCEPVCPVYAAYHTPDGLNAQVYNRCVGTRYCANNCPYKVRVFNWFEFSDIPEPMNWAYNPDVTVRGEGVMEKCTFCVQRIRQAEHRAALEGRGVADGDVVPACQQSCPAEAIVFGNIRDPGSQVAQVTANERTYRVLDVLINTQPAISYLRKVTFHPVEEIHV